MKGFLTFVFVFFIGTLFAQTDVSAVKYDTKQTVTPVPYRLFATQNMWTFIKLNTRNGQLWQVQYSMKDNRFVSKLDLSSKVSMEHEQNDRFTLYPTQNLNTFILLDQIDGRTWQVQWSIDYDKRMVLPIE
jgi:hypothetical protein